MNIQLSGPQASGRSQYFSGRELTNWFISFNPNQELPKNTSVTTPTSGLNPWTTVGDGPIRSMCEVDGVLYVLSGLKFYSVDNSGSSTLLGSLTEINVERPDIIPGSSNKIAVFNGDDSYIYDSSGGTWTLISDADFDGATRADYFDGYWLVTYEGALYWSDNAAPTSWNGLSVLVPTYKPDKIVNVFVLQEQVYLLKEKTIELFVQSGDSSAPFIRQNLSSNHFGIAAPESAAILNNALFFLSSSDAGEVKVLKVMYGQIQDISTPAIIYEILKSEGYKSAYAMAYSELGHDFYQITIPDRELTLVYDVTTNLWHKRESYHGIDNIGASVYGRHLANAIVSFNSRTYAGDYRNNKIYEVDKNYYLDNGEHIRRIIETSNLNLENNYFSIGTLYLDFETGMTEDGDEDPQLKLEVSRDGGRTYGPPMYRSLGRTGEGSQRVQFNSLGTSRNFKLKLTFTGKGDYKFGMAAGDLLSNAAVRPQQ